MPTVLTSAQSRFLRGQAHGLKALLQTGAKGLTPAFLTELDAVLEQHELVKVKVGGDERDARLALIDELAAKTDSALVQRIGHVAVLYRPSKDHRQIVLPRK
ncbi:MAG: ribosome assembly RNA-binding protein YhbY [Pseudoxanthomonas sp.]|jgi:RNA-binding protein|nr:ribosome assembly RNA-binding protein YhbY [Pseudoxanthomonas sp.]